MRHRGLALLGVAMALSAVVAARQTPVPPQEPEVFRAEVDVVRIDVTVIDRARRPVRGLTADDFEVQEDGRPQRIVAVTEVRASEEPPLTARMRFVPRDVVANDRIDRLGDGRVFVIVLDDFNIPFDDDRIVRETRQWARYVVDSMGPTDVAAVIFTARVGNTVDFTDDRMKLLDAIDRFVPPDRNNFTMATPQGMGPTEGDIVQRWAPSMMRSQCQRSQPLAPTLETVTRRLSSIPNRRKSVVLLSTGLTLTLGETNGCPGTLSGIIRDSFALAARSNINFYPIDPAGYRGYEEYLQHPLRAMKGIGFPGPMTAGGARNNARRTTDFLKTLAENTGGRAVVLTDNIEGEIDRIFAEDGSYYLLGYQSSNNRSDGKFRAIKVSVKNRSGLEVRARSGYFAPRPGELARTERDAAPTQRELGLAGLTSDVGVSLRATAVPIGPAAPGSRDALVAFALTLGYPASAGSVNEQLTVTRNIYTLDGSAGAPVQERVGFEIGPAGLDGQRKALYYVLPLAPGRRQVRYEIRSAALNRANSIVVEVEVPDFSRSRLGVSGLVLGTEPSAGSSAEAVLGSLMSIVPSTERDFPTATGLKAFLRITPSAAAPPSAITVRAEVSNGLDTTVFQTERTVPLEAQLENSSVPVEVPLTFEDQARGPHLLSVTVTAPGVPAVRRDLLFRIR